MEVEPRCPPHARSLTGVARPVSPARAARLPRPPRPLGARRPESPPSVMRRRWSRCPSTTSGPATPV